MQVDGCDISDLAIELATHCDALVGARSHFFLSTHSSIHAAFNILNMRSELANPIKLPLLCTLSFSVIRQQLKGKTIVPMLSLNALPLWAFFIVTVVLALLCVEGGFRFGKHHQQDTTKENEASVGSMVGSTLSLLAFLLTFTFGIAAARFDDRRTLVLEEANAIGTTYSRADLIEEPSQGTIKNLLREYVDVRINDTTQSTIPEQAPLKPEVLQDRLWSEAAVIGQKHPGSEMSALFIESLNEMIDVHAKRVTARRYARVPESIWGALFLVAALSMIGVGYHSGLIGKRSWPACVMLIVTFGTVMLLVADLDRPSEGSLTANQQPMIDLSKKIGLPSR